MEKPTHKANMLMVTNGTPGAIRTRDLSLRRRTLYPAELRAHIMKFRENGLLWPLAYI